MDIPVVDDLVLGGRYRLGSLLGSGGMAEVYDGWDERLSRPVAVKLLRPDLAANPELGRRFALEAQAAARLAHPNVVAVYDAGEDRGRSYIVMERLPGESVADRIGRGPLDMAWLRRMAGEVLGALGAAHQAGIIHRDIKPANILLGAEGQAKVADFGIARVAESRGAPGETSLTAAGFVLGTPAYLAPERAMGHPSTPQSDLYSLGVVLYEGLTGRKPFAGTTPVAIAAAAMQGAAENPMVLRPDADPHLVEVIGRAMAWDQAARYPTAAAMAAALRQPAPAPTAVLPLPLPVGPEPRDIKAPLGGGRLGGVGLGGAGLGPAAAGAGMDTREPAFAPVAAGAGIGTREPAFAPGAAAGPAPSTELDPGVARPAGMGPRDSRAAAVAPTAADQGGAGGTVPAALAAPATRLRPPRRPDARHRLPGVPKQWAWIALGAVVVVAVIVIALASNPGSKARANTTGTGAPGSSATTPSTANGATNDATAAALRGVATTLASSTSPAAPQLRAGLLHVAGTSGPTARAAAATALSTQTVQWFQQGQLSAADYAAAVGVLHLAGAPSAPAPTVPASGGGKHGSSHGNSGERGD